MRKFTLFLTLFFATAMTMVAQITSVDQLSNDKCYTVVSKDTGRGGIYAAPGATMVDMCGVTYNQAQACHSIERNANDPAQQFAFVSYNDQLYLYSVSEKKFIVKNGDVNKLTNEAPIEPVVVNLEAASGGNYFSIKLNNTHYMTASPGWCTNPSRNTCLQSTLTTQSASDGWDDGAWYTITEAADFDATEAIKLIDPTYEPEVPAAVYYRLKEVTTGNYLFVAGYNEDHSTGAIGSVQVVALNEESGDQKFAIEDAGDGNVYLVSETGYYIVCRTWNVDAWNDGTKSALKLVDAGNGEYYIMNGSNYFKVEEVGGINYPFCDAPYDKAAKWVLEKVGETTEPEAPETFAVTASLFPTPQDPENITEIKGIRVQHNEGAVISEVPTAWTLTNENGDVIETRAEWGLTSFDDVLVLPTTTITEAGTYTLNIPAGSLKTDEGKEVEAATFSWTIKAAEEPGYKHVDGNSGNGSRRLDSFTITDGTNSLSVTDIQTDNFSPIFADKTANVLETVAGATISFTEFNWLGQWMHAYGYIDYNNDYTFAQDVNADGTTGGELVTYNYYTPDDNTDPTDSWGYTSNAQTANLDTYYDEDFNESKGLPKFILPADLAAGDYRMRVKIDWNNLDPMCSSDIRSIGGCQCDFIIRVAAPVEPLTVVGVTPNEAVEVLDVITVEYSDEIAGEFDVMGMTQIYVGSKSNGAAYEVNGNVLTIDLFNAITTPGEYALHIPAGLIKRVSDGSDITCNGEIVFTVKEAGYEYNTGDRNHAER
ncbi:MAG: hypothetical protein IKD40_02690, partial [Bacteroidaceae bacterium]|nr:hypothetical protein [Bacteroidaceae bacterium]